jgi:hypothetical protein
MYSNYRSSSELAASCSLQHAVGKCAYICKTSTCVLADK